MSHIAVHGSFFGVLFCTLSLLRSTTACRCYYVLSRNKAVWPRFPNTRESTLFSIFHFAFQAGIPVGIPIGSVALLINLLYYEYMFI
jgi:hypothetical protein